MGRLSSPCPDPGPRGRTLNLFGGYTVSAFVELEVGGIG